MKVSHRVLAVAALAAVAGVSIALPAFGADTADEWIKPLSGGADKLSASLTTIGAPILGLCLAAFGGWSVMTGRVDWNKLWMFLLGGAFIGMGPSFATWFMTLVTKSGS
jgi:hypothetical protein